MVGDRTCLLTESEEDRTGPIALANTYTRSDKIVENFVEFVVLVIILHSSSQHTTEK